MDFAGMSGQPVGCLRPLSAHLMCAITATMWGGCCVKRAGVGRNRWNGPVSAMKKLSTSGMKNDGPSVIKKSRIGASDHSLGRRSRLLSVADGGAYLGASRTNATAEGQADAGSSLGDQGHHAGWESLHASAFRVV